MKDHSSQNQNEEVPSRDKGKLGYQVLMRKKKTKEYLPLLHFMSVLVITRDTEK